MNEQLRQLAIEADHYALSKANIYEDSYNREFLEKFAELIVMECSNHLLQKQYVKPLPTAYYEGFNEALFYGSVAIQKHFGLPVKTFSFGGSKT
jgi:hypothetical protein